MTCPSCEANNEDAAVACWSCGYPLSSAALL